MKNCLFISYYFPPLGGSGVQRSLKFVKYLPQFGWHPTVLTQKGSGYIRDESMMNEVASDIKVTRAITLETSSLITLFEKLGIRRKSVGIQNRRAQTTTSFGNCVYSALSEIKEKLHESVLFPDGQIGWLPSCYFYGRRLIENNNYDLIYSSSSPMTAHIAAGLLKQHFGLKWIADFRDEWTTNPLLQKNLAKHKTAHHLLEQLILRRADRVIAVSQTSANTFASLNGGYQPEKFVAIPNGYDHEDFKGSLKWKKNEKFTIAHVGKFFGDCQPADLMKAIERLFKSGACSREEIEVLFVGPTTGIKNLDAYIRQFPDILRITGAVSHSKAIEYMCTADALLLVLPDSFGNQALAGKLFEYLASKRPVIAIIPMACEASNIINETSSGFVIPNRDDDLLHSTLANLIDNWRKNLPGTIPNEENIKQYSRKILAKKLAEQMNSLCLKNARGAN